VQPTDYRQPDGDVVSLGSFFLPSGPSFCLYRKVIDWNAGIASFALFIGAIAFLNQAKDCTVPT